MSELYERLSRAVTLEGEDAAVRVHAEYVPQLGPGAKVFPSTYLPSDGTRYHFEQRWGDDGEPIDVVVLDSYQSQANRAESALREHAEELGLPQLIVETEVESRKISVSNLDAPHRSRDAYFLDSELDGIRFDETDVGRALNSVTAGDATASLRFAPYDLVYGVWDSHRGKRLATKFPRSYTSEMIGWHVLQGRKGATKGDPLNLPGNSSVPLAEWRPGTQTGQRKKAEVELNELGHGMIPGQAEVTSGGVSVKSITRQAVLSLAGLARFRFPTADQDASEAGRSALAALALVGDRLAFAGAGLHLRSGSDLVLVDETVEWVRRGGSIEPLELSVDHARELLDEARNRLAAAGVEWSGAPVRMQPTERLRTVIEQTFDMVTLDAEE